MPFDPQCESVHSLFSPSLQSSLGFLTTLSNDAKLGRLTHENVKNNSGELLWAEASLCAQCPDKSFSRGGMWRAQLMGQTSPADSSSEASHACSRLCKLTVFLLWSWLTFTAFCQCFYLAPDRSSFVLAPLPEHAARFQRVEIIPWSSGGLVKGRAGELKFSEARCLLIRPTEGSFLVFLSPVCNYCCWLASLQYVHFPALPMFSLCCQLPIVLW